MLLRLTVNQAGVAVDSIVDWAVFMRLRAQRPVIPAEPENFDTIAELTSTSLTFWATATCPPCGCWP
jgi:hypothetical protein